MNCTLINSSKEMVKNKITDFYSLFTFILLLFILRFRDTCGVDVQLKRIVIWYEWEVVYKYNRQLQKLHINGSILNFLFKFHWLSSFSYWIDCFRFLFFSLIEYLELNIESFANEWFMIYDDFITNTYKTSPNRFR